MQTPNFGLILPQQGDMVFGDQLIKILERLDETLYEALYQDYVLFQGTVKPLVAPPPGPPVPVPMSPVADAFFPHDVTMKFARIIVPAGPTNVLTAPMQLYFIKVSGPPPILTGVTIPAGPAGLDVVVPFLAGASDIDSTDLVRLLIGNPLGAVGACLLEVALAAEIRFPEE